MHITCHVYVFIYICNIERERDSSIILNHLVYIYNLVYVFCCFLMLHNSVPDLGYDHPTAWRPQCVAQRVDRGPRRRRDGGNAMT